MPKLNRYNDGGFVYGQWREVGRRVDPVTGDIIITERRDGSKDVRYDTRGVSWRKGYEDWLAAGNEGTIDDFKLEAEAWKRSQDKKEFDSQNRERRIKRNQEGEGDDGEKPSDDPRPDDFVGDGPGVGGPDGGGPGDVSRPAKDDNVSRPRRPEGEDVPDVSILPKLPLVELESDMYMPLIPGMTLSDEEVDRLVAEGVLPRSLPAMTPEQMGDVILEEGEGVGEVLPESRVESEYNLQTDSRTNRRGKEIVKQTYTDNINLLRDDGSSTVNTRQVDRSKTGRPTRSRGRSVYQEFDSEGNRIFRDVNRFESGGSISKENMYHNKKQMGMGGKNMPRLMKKGGKTFPDLTGDGKVTRADILAGRGVIGKKKKKSMANGGRNDDPPSLADRLSSNLLNAAELALGGPLAYIYRGYMEDRAREAAESARPDQDPYGFVGPVMPGDDMTGPTQEDEPRPSRSIRRMPIRVEPIDSRRAPEISLPRNRDLIVPNVESDREVIRDPFTLPDDLRGMAYGGKVKLMKRGGTVEYGLGGAVMGGVNALMAGKGLAGAAGAAAKGFATPGSGIAQGAKLAGNLAQKSNNPLLQNVGKMAGMASNFLPGGNPMGALGAIGGMFQQKHGGYVSPKHRLF